MAMALAEFDIIGIFHISGKKHEVPDCLSRFPATDYSNQDKLRDLPLLSIKTIGITEMQEADDEIKQIKQDLAKGNSRTNKKFVIKKNVLYYKNTCFDKTTLFIPKHMRNSVLVESHDDPLFGAHLGFYKTWKKIEMRYYWPRMKKDIANYVRSCHKCQQRKIPRHKKFGTMQFIEVPKQAFERVQIDVMGPFTTSSKGNKYVVTAIDYLTKWIEARAIKESTTENIAKFTVEQIICRHGCPKIIHTDRGTTFTSSLFQEINKFMGITHRVSTSYHPESQGLVEKSNSTLTDCMSMYAATNLKNWDVLLPHIVFAVNCSIQETTQESPFYLLYGREAVLPIESQLNLSKHATLEELIQNVQDARIIAGNRILSRQAQYAKKVNETRQH